MISIPNFQWCLNPTCPSGQEHISGARFTCYSCHHQYCVRHGTAWHQNETCNQYDTRWIAARIQDQASEEWKAVQAKKCPKCSALIEKDGGCDHMACTAPGCSHQFNWSGAEQYEAQDSVMPLMVLKSSIAVPQEGRRFKISRVFRSMFFRGRDIC
jgi:sulfatase maturation enzyme AslB (radical SAM superfamily)